MSVRALPFNRLIHNSNHAHVNVSLLRSLWSAELQRFPSVCSRASRRRWRTEPTSYVTPAAALTDRQAPPSLTSNEPHHAAREPLPAAFGQALCHPTISSGWLMVCSPPFFFFFSFPQSFRDVWLSLGFPHHVPSFFTPHASVWGNHFKLNYLKAPGSSLPEPSLNSLYLFGGGGRQLWMFLCMRLL